MSMLSVHLNALEAKTSSYHEFLLRYKKHEKTFYGFIEGKGDTTFYQGFIESNIPSDWKIELWPAGNRDSVFQIHETINWRRFPKKRICFFVDRDLAELIPTKLKTDQNIYITDFYSIENDLAQPSTCRRILTEICGLATAKHDELDEVCRLFEEELEKFQVALIPVMACILAWQRKRENAQLNGINLQDLFSIEKGILNLNLMNIEANLIDCIHSKCKVAPDRSIDLASHQAEFEKNFLYRKFTRGKFLFWFLIEFSLSVYRHALEMLPSLTKSPSMKVTLGHKNSVAVIANRSRIPQSLLQFISTTYCSYCKSKAAVRNSTRHGNLLGK